MEVDAAAHAYRDVHPREYIERFVSQNVRPDGRALSEYRKVRITNEVLPTCDHSSQVQIGDTRVLCGIRYLVDSPSESRIDEGMVKIKVKGSPYCSMDSEAEVVESNASLEKWLSAIIDQMINKQDLCIEESVAVMILSVDFVVVNDDGNVVDAMLLSLVHTLSSFRMPVLKVIENENLAHRNGKEVVQIGEQRVKKLNILCYPIGVTFGMFGDVLLLDPNLEETNVLDGMFTIVLSMDGSILSLYKPNGPAIPYQVIEGSYELCSEHVKSMLKVLSIKQ